MSPQMAGYEFAVGKYALNRGECQWVIWIGLESQTLHFRAISANVQTVSK